MASQPLEEMVAQQQRAAGEDPSAPPESLRDRSKPWGFPQLSALGSLAEFWLLWNEGSPQAPPGTRKPVKVGLLRPGLGAQFFALFTFPAPFPSMRKSWTVGLLACCRALVGVCVGWEVCGDVAARLPMTQAGRDLAAWTRSRPVTPIEVGRLPNCKGKIRRQVSVVRKAEPGAAFLPCTSLSRIGACRPEEGVSHPKNRVGTEGLANQP